MLDRIDADAWESDDSFDGLCSCPAEHSITKLGHCRTCRFFASMTDADRAAQRGEQIPVLRATLEHADGTRHNFGWATYSDARQSTGVCRCGVSEIHYDAMNGSRSTLMTSERT